MAAPELDRVAPAAYAPPEVRGAADTQGDADEVPSVPTEVPPETTPTFELEMLVSGAVLVSLVQLIGVSDGWVRAARAVDASSRVVLMLMVVFAKTLLYALSATFVVHLVVRAYWVGLIGLDSVFPGGPRWDRLKTAGPYSRTELARTIPPLRRVAARVDNVASTLFSAGFLLALLTLYAVAVTAPALGVGLITERITAGRVGFLTPYLALLVIFYALSYGPLLIDRVVGRRIAGATPAGRLLARSMRVSRLLAGSRLWGPIYFNLVTNVRATIAMPLVYVGIFAAMGAALRDITNLSDGPRVQHPFVPADLAGGLDPLRYDALRSPGADRGRLPSVQSDVIDGPYIRLFVPLGRSPAVSRAVLARCPGVRPVHDGADSASAARELACLTQIYATTLDGTPVTAPAHFAASADESSLGIVRYIPTDGLAKGEHVLRVAALPEEGDRPQPPRRIPFWR